jgi:threonine dehydratase
MPVSPPAESTAEPTGRTPPTFDTPPVTYADIAGAAERLDGVAHRTPVMTSRTVDDRVGASVFFKCENLQRIGAFKFRGGYNVLSQLSPKQQERGVIAYSSGNHAQAIALAGRILDIPRVILMPEDAPQVKLAATRDYGAEVVTYDPETTVREELGQEIAEERGLTLIPPYDHPDVIAGQGTTADELMQQVEALDVLLVCCGGGGLLSGCAIAAHEHAPDCTVIGVEPARGDDATRSFHTGELHTVSHPDTIADGARTPYLGDYTFPLVLAHADDMVTVSDDALRHATRFLWERMKLVVEPTGALATAALLDGVVPGEGRRIGAIISGGNVDVTRAADLFRGVDG